MIGIVDILQGIEEQIRGIFPGEAIYKDYQPSDFTRPSFLLTAGKVQAQPYHAAGLELQMAVKIRGFVEVDEYYQSHFAVLLERMARVMNLFYCGYVPVGERNPHIEKLSGEYQYDYFEVDMILQWGEMNDGDGEALPLMQEFYLNKSKQEG